MRQRSPIRILLDGDRETPEYWRILGLLESRVTAVVRSSAGAGPVEQIVRETMHLFLDALPDLESERDVLLFLVHTLRHVIATSQDERHEEAAGFRGTGEEQGPVLVRSKPVGGK